MRNFSIFMIACAIACGNFAEAKLSHEQVRFLNNNVIGRDFRVCRQICLLHIIANTRLSIA